MRGWGKAALAAVMATAAPALAAPPTPPAKPSKLIVMGDSLVDAGRVWVATGGAIPSSAQGYFFGRFTNGPTWVDIINKRLTGSFTAPAPLVPFAAPPGPFGTNFAVGGSRGADNAFTLTPTNPPGVAVLPGLPSQAAQALFPGADITKPQVIDTAALYVISFGNNDANALLRGVVQADGSTKMLNAAEQSQFIAAFAGNIGMTAGAILSKGGRVLVGGVPNPFHPFYTPLQSALDAALNPLSTAFGGNLIRYSYANSFAGMQAAPTAYGLKANTSFTTNCLDKVSAVAPNLIYCDNYFSFDGIHPTAQVHQALARDIAPLVGLGAVPEPQSWALLIAGFGLTGAALRRRRMAALQA